MFLPQCLSVALDPPFLLVGQSQDVTIRISPSVPEFLVLSASSSNKRATLQISADQLVQCAVGDGQTTNGVIKSSNEIVCSLSASSSAATTSLTVKFNETALFAPVSFSFVDCGVATSCSDCT